MHALIWSGIFAVSLAALLKSADIFTTSAEKIGLRLKISPFIIGVTIVALGTSLPELATSVIAVFENQSEIVIGNVVGSNIANILLVIGAASIIAKKLSVDRNILNVDLPFVLGSALLLFIMVLDGKFGMVESVISLFVLGVYIIYNIKSHRPLGEEELKELSKEKRKLKKEQEQKIGYKYPVLLVISAAAIYFSADYTVQAIIVLAQVLNIGAEVIAVSAVAVGTSLPELVVSAVAAKKGNADIAIGNVTGSNIFNALGVMGGAGLAGTIYIPEHIIVFTIPAMIFITILYMFVSMDKNITRWEGFMLLSIFIAFMAKTFGAL